MKIRMACSMVTTCLVAWLLAAPGLAAPAEEPAVPVEKSVVPVEKPVAPPVVPVEKSVAPVEKTEPGDVQVTVRLANQELEAAVFEALRHDTFTFPYDIAVSATDGKVGLRGKVDTEAAKVRVERIASEIAGVASVDNRMTIDPNLFAKTDRMIKQDVETELNWSPLVRVQKVIVQVADGIVTLHGEVIDLQAFQSATANSVQGGAKKVVNMLTIKPNPNIILPSPWLSLRGRPVKKTY